MFVPEEKKVVLNSTNYIIKAFPADYGLDVMNTLQALEGNPPARLMKEIVMRSVTANNIQPTDEWFNKKFSRNYKELYELFKEIVDFNFGTEDENSPNGEGAISG